MPKLPPHPISNPPPRKPKYLFEALLLLCVAAIAACAGIAAHCPQWQKEAILAAVLIMIPMCWAGERSLNTDWTPPES